MTEQEARDFFEHLPLDERLRLVRDILADIEGRIGRARDELNGASRQLVLPELKELLETAPPPQPIKRSKTSDQTPLPTPTLSPAAREAQVHDRETELQDFADLDLADLTGGESHAVHRLRLMDAAAQYEKLLKKYGYVKSVPGPKEILQQEQQAAQASGRQRPDTRWADWVAKDAATLDRPYPHEWSDWVAIGDDEAEE